jgi:3-demethoxyubiquinol 3-hydroxylase
MSHEAMSADRRVADRHLRVIHACEKGATGVYWGHRAVASVLFRDLVPQLNQMHSHEMEHFALFTELMKRRGVRPVATPALWCIGGIAYGVLTALFGRRAIWKSTAVIEETVERELKVAAVFFEYTDYEVHSAIQLILLDELQHKQLGESGSQGAGPVDGAVSTAAKTGASISKNLAERL